VLIATPEKALCDTVIATAGLLFRNPGRAREWLLEEMRMDSDVLRTLNTGNIRSWLTEALKKESLQQLVKALEEL
jgi:hypothetical protein